MFIHGQRAAFSDSVGALEDPVLPGGQATVNFGFGGFYTAETEILLHPGQCIGREADPFFDCNADLVFPIDVIE